jgi:hypothetical protein
MIREAFLLTALSVLSGQTSRGIDDEDDAATAQVNHRRLRQRPRS